MPLQVEKNLSDVFLLYRFSLRLGGGGGFRMLPDSCLLHLAKKDKVNPWTLAQCWFRQSSEHSTGYVCVFGITHFRKILSVLTLIPSSGERTECNNQMILDHQSHCVFAKENHGLSHLCFSNVCPEWPAAITQQKQDKCEVIQMVSLFK